MFALAQLVEDRESITTSSDYHKILFKTGYYNSQSLLFSLDILCRYYKNKRKQISKEELSHLSEPMDTLTLYEFMFNDQSSLDINRFKDRLVKLIKEIHYYHVAGDGSEVTYVTNRYTRPLESTRGILMALLEAK